MADSLRSGFVAPRGAEVPAGHFPAVHGPTVGRIHREVLEAVDVGCLTRLSGIRRGTRRLTGNGHAMADARKLAFCNTSRQRGGVGRP